MNARLTFNIDGQASVEGIDGSQIEMRVDISDTGVSIQAIAEDGCPDTDVFVELMDGKLDIHVWDKQTIDGGDPIFSRTLLEVQNGKGN